MLPICVFYFYKMPYFRDLKVTGSVEVRGSIPLHSTIFFNLPSSIFSEKSAVSQSILSLIFKIHKYIYTPRRYIDINH